MFEAVRSFLAGAKIIIASDGIEENEVARVPTLPVIVCSAIAVEIALKAILKLRGISRPRGDGHDLHQLFSMLDKEEQNAILNFQQDYTGLPANQARLALTSAKDVFKTWRYAYEQATLETTPEFIFHFGLALSEYIQLNAVIERSSNGWKLLS
jgi:hypothetical protein